MIELQRDRLVFSFPEVHENAKLTITFQRTLRIPDDETIHRLPPGLGAFPLAHVDDHADRIPTRWLEHGGVMLPMYQSEALWINLDSGYCSSRAASYPFAIKVATGKVDAISGNEWSSGLHREPQDYMVAPKQPWLDGYCVEKGIIRQFVAMPLGAGYSAEEQLTGAAEHGGLQVMVYPMRAEVFERRFPVVPRDSAFSERADSCIRLCAPLCDMGLAPGGRMRQEIYEDPYDLADWDEQHFSRCFVHIANSLVWKSITGTHPPTTPPTAREYTDSGLPWYDYYDDGATALEGSSKLRKLKSVLTMGQHKGDVPLPENESVNPQNIVTYRKGLKKGQVREGAF